VRIHRSILKPVVFTTLLFLCLAFAAGCGGDSDGGVKEDDLGLAFFLDQVTDVAAIAEPPLGSAELTSSYDRSGGNQDWGNYNVPAQSDGLVDVATFDGPGVIRRIWYTGQDGNKWQFFFDGESTPRFTGFKPAEGEPAADSPHAAFAAPLAGRASGGNYIYTPIPYAKSLRIAVAGDYKPARPYFQINTETMPAGTNVRSFPKKLSGADQQAVKTAITWWTGLKSEQRASTPADNSKTVTIAAGASAELIKLDGAGTLRSFAVNLPPRGGSSAIEYQDRLRQLVLEVRYNGSATPHIAVPFGDFFNNAFWYRPYSSHYLSYLDGTYLCRLPMPYESGLVLSLRNESATALDITCAHEVDSTRAPNARYLQAAWAEKRSFIRPAGQPLNLVSTSGAGHLVSCYLSCYATEPRWDILEGDDLIYRDGEMKASFNGTGLEDYFNGAWYYTGLSDLPWSGLLEKAAMRTSQYRVHGPDKIDFNDGFRFAFEFGHVLGSPSGGNTSRGYMSGLVLWYADTPIEARPLPKKRTVPTDRIEQATALAGVLELEGIGEWTTAAERCDWLAERLSTNKDTFQARAAATRAFPGGTPDFAGIQSTSLQNRREKSLLTEIPGTGKAVIGLQANGSAELFVDGKRLLQSKSPTALEAASFAWTGDHEIAIRFIPNQQQAWISAGLRIGDKVVDLLDEETGYSRVQPTAWPATGEDSATWPKVSPSQFRRPTMGVWALQANAVTGFQHHPIIISASNFDRQRSAQPIYLKRKITF